MSSKNDQKTLEGCPNLKVDCSPRQNDVFHEKTSFWRGLQSTFRFGHPSSVLGTFSMSVLTTCKRCPKPGGALTVAGNLSGVPELVARVYQLIGLLPKGMLSQWQTRRQRRRMPWRSLLWRALSTSSSASVECCRAVALWRCGLLVRRCRAVGAR